MCHRSRGPTCPYPGSARRGPTCPYPGSARRGPTCPLRFLRGGNVDRDLRGSRVSASQTATGATRISAGTTGAFTAHILLSLILKVQIAMISKNDQGLSNQLIQEPHLLLYEICINTATLDTTPYLWDRPLRILMESYQKTRDVHPLQKKKVVG